MPEYRIRVYCPWPRTENRMRAVPDGDKIQVREEPGMRPLGRGGRRRQVMNNTDIRGKKRRLTERRMDERRLGERRALFERRVINVSPLHYYETRFVPDRRLGERRQGDRRQVNA
jgi:hypothetical protein